MLLGLAVSGTAQAQQSQAAVSDSTLDGRWAGSAFIFQVTPDDIREDSAGFEITLVTADSGTRGGLKLTTSSARELTGAMHVQARNAGAITFSSEVDGADVVFSGATTDSTMTGTFVATQNGQTVGTGNWSVKRSR
jgi:hypothetical protein